MMEFHHFDNHFYEVARMVTACKNAGENDDQNDGQNDGLNAGMTTFHHFNCRNDEITQFHHFDHHFDEMIYHFIILIIKMME